MQFKSPNRRAVSILIIGLVSLAFWYALQSGDTDTSWLALAQRIALLAFGGLLTIVGLNLCWISMKKPSEPTNSSTTNHDSTLKK